MKPAAASVLLLAFISGCADYNLRQGDYSTYIEFAASRYAANGLLPPTLVPRSARNIHYQYNIDSTEVLVEFDFAAGDEDELVAPFLSPDMLQHLNLQQQGLAPDAPKSASISLVRCDGPAVEFLTVDKHTHAKYWTSKDREIRRVSCATQALQDPTSA